MTHRIRLEKPDPEKLARSYRGGFLFLFYPFLSVWARE